MSYRLQIMRSSTVGRRPTGKQPGELYVNYADKALGVIDAVGAPLDLIVGAPAIVANPPTGLKQTIVTGILAVPKLEVVEVQTAISVQPPNLNANAAGRLYKTSFVPIDQAGGDGRYLRLTGGTLSGNLTVQDGQIVSRRDGSNISLRRGDGSQEAQIAVGPAGTVLFAIGGAIPAEIGPAGTALANANTLVSREKGDARYLQLTGGTLSGNLAAVRLTTTAPYSTLFPGNAYIHTDGLIYRSSVVPIDQAGGDARYLRLTGGTVSGDVVAERLRATAIPSNTAAAPNVYISSTGWLYQTSFVPLNAASGDARYYTKGQSDGRYQLQGSYLTTSSGYTRAQVDSGFVKTSGASAIYPGTGFGFRIYAPYANTVAAMRVDTEASLYNPAFHAFSVFEGTTRTVAIFAKDGTMQTKANSYGGLSDERLKTGIVDASPQLEDLLQLRVRNFAFKDAPEIVYMGLVAQEVEPIKPRLVDEDADGMKGVKYSVLVPCLIKALQELTAEFRAYAAAHP
ncbi:MAG: tail fiber domain-containing protein [Pikeienuella sp.]|uniref:tail fiber domain-containing protein n=1 Tax=Pikeienuella sp. TaxID=2831957 RepID=UPI0039196AC0